MRYNSYGFQRQAAYIAAVRGPVYGVRFIRARAENARRFAAVHS